MRIRGGRTSLCDGDQIGTERQIWKRPLAGPAGTETRPATKTLYTPPRQGKVKRRVSGGEPLKTTSLGEGHLKGRTALKLCCTPKLFGHIVCTVQNVCQGFMYSICTVI